MQKKIIINHSFWEKLWTSEMGEKFILFIAATHNPMKNDEGENDEKILVLNDSVMNLE